MRRVKPRPRCMRQRIWKVMRIMRRFTVPDLCRAIEGATVANVQSYVSRLYRENYLSKFGHYQRGQIGEYQAYSLIKDIGPTMPLFLKGRHQKKEKEKETEVEENQLITSAGELTQEAHHDAA